VKTHQLQVLTTSAAKAYRRCPRLYELSYERCYRMASSPSALAFGTLGHRGLEAWWIAAKDAPGEPEIWLSAALTALSSERDAYSHAKAAALLAAYHERWRDMLWNGQPMRVVAVEAEFRGPLINPATGAESRTWDRGGKIDAIVEVDGYFYTVEHKTTSEDIGPGSDYWARLRMDPQVSNYHVGARMLGYDVMGCIYDVLRKPALKPFLATPESERTYTKPTKNSPSRLHANQRLEDESPADYHDRLLFKMADNIRYHFDRCEVVRLETEEDDAAFDTWQTALQIRESQRLARWPRNPEACMHFGRACGFFPVCTGAGSLDDQTLYRKAERAHEELSAAPIAAE
jgi:hypothetical protein